MPLVGYRYKSTPAAETRRKVLSDCAIGSPFHVYIFLSGSFCKIGHSCKLAQRLHNIQAANPLPVSVYALYKIESEPASCLIESHAHQKLSEFHVHGEWFEVSPLKAAQAIESILFEYYQRINDVWFAVADHDFSATSIPGKYAKRRQVFLQVEQDEKRYASEQRKREGIIAARQRSNSGQKTQ